MSIPFAITDLQEYEDRDRRQRDPLIFGGGSVPPPQPPAPEVVTEQPRPILDPNELRTAAQEDPFGEQPTRHAAYLRWQQMDPATRETAFQIAVDHALTAEGVTNPAERARWKQAMMLVAKGDGETPGENPDLNPFAQAYDLPDQPSQGVNPRLVGTPQGDRTASSARGYFQFLHRGSPDGSTPSTWDLVRLPSREGEDELPYEGVFDPVSNARGYIRAVNRSSNYHDPIDPWNEKRKIKVWNPLLPLPPGLTPR